MMYLSGEINISESGIIYAQKGKVHLPASQKKSMYVGNLKENKEIAICDM